MAILKRQTQRSRGRWAIGATLIAAIAAGCGSSSEAPSSVSAPKIIGSRGAKPGRFSFPRGIDVAPDGAVAVTDRSGRVQILTAEGESIREWALPKIDNGTPTGLIFDSTGPGEATLLIADTHNSRIMRYTIRGELLATFGEYGGQPGQMIYPTDVAVDEEGNIYVTEYGENDRVMKFTRGGEFITEWGSFGTGPGQFQRPLALVWAAPDRIIVADTCNHRFQEFTTEGELIAIWGEVGVGAGQFNYPYDVALGADGLLYVSEYGNNRVQCVQIGGKSRGMLGEAGTMPGQFGTPWGIASDGAGRLYIADTNNHRLQVIGTEELGKARL